MSEHTDLLVVFEVFRVIHEYQSPEPKYLELRIGQIVTLVDTIGEDRGWWKGKLNNKVSEDRFARTKRVGTQLNSLSF